MGRLLLLCAGALFLGLSLALPLRITWLLSLPRLLLFAARPLCVTRLLLLRLAALSTVLRLPLIAARALVALILLSL